MERFKWKKYCISLKYKLYLGLLFSEKNKFFTRKFVPVAHTMKGTPLIVKNCRLRKGMVIRMNVKQQKIGKLPFIRIVIESGIWFYTVVVCLISSLNIAGISDMQSFFMKPMFLGISLLLCLLYEIMNDNADSEKLKKGRKILIGLILASVIVLCDVKLVLFLILILGLAIADSTSKNAFDVQDVLQAIFSALVALELYSILLIFYEKPSDVAGQNMMERFLTSWGLDLIFLICCVLMVCCRKQKFLKRITTFLKKCARYRLWIGCIISVITIGVFLFFCCVTKLDLAFTSSAYVIRSMDEDGYVLTEKYSENSEEQNISFEKYVGTDNQKVLIDTLSDGKCVITFLDSGKALDCLSHEIFSWERDGTLTQQWNMLSLGDGISLVACTGETLFRNESNLAEGGFLDQKQYFKLEKAVMSEDLAGLELGLKEEFQCTALIRDMITFFENGAVFIFMGMSFVLGWMSYAVHKSKVLFYLILPVMYIYALFYGAFSVIVTLLVAVFGLLKLYPCKEIYNKTKKRNWRN